MEYLYITLLWEVDGSLSLTPRSSVMGMVCCDVCDIDVEHYRMIRVPPGVDAPLETFE